MKICLVNNLLAPWSRGGAEKIVNTLAEAVLADGHEVIFISTKPPGAATPPTKIKHYYLSSCYQALSGWPYLVKLFWHSGDFFNIFRYQKLKKFLQAEAPDLLITNNLTGIGFFIGRLAQKLQIKHSHILHDIQLLHPSGLLPYGRVGELATPLAKFYQSLTRQHLGQPRVVVAPSQWLMNEHLKRHFFTDSLSIVRLNPVDNLSATNHRPFDKAVVEYIFLFVGQIEEHKGIKLLLSAWTDFISRTKAEAKLKIVGDGSLLASLKLTKTPQVEFVGRLAGQALSQSYAQANCLVVPSLCYENSPTVIYEATLAGLPVIASALGGSKELLADDYLFRPEVKNLSDKLFWAYQKRSELIAPRLALLSGAAYWQRLKALL